VLKSAKNILNYSSLLVVTIIKASIIKKMANDDNNNSEDRFEACLGRLSDLLFLLDVLLCLVSLILGPVYLVQCEEHRAVSAYLLLHGLSYFLLATAFALVVGGLLVGWSRNYEITS
jgi:hypothetical protein